MSSTQGAAEQSSLLRSLPPRSDRVNGLRVTRRERVFDLIGLRKCATSRLSRGRGVIPGSRMIGASPLLPPSSIITTINLISWLPSNVPKCPQMTSNMWRQEILVQMCVHTSYVYICKCGLLVQRKCLLFVVFYKPSHEQLALQYDTFCVTMIITIYL